MKEIIINVEGMVCGGCENRVINALKSVDGVSEVIADHKTGVVKVSVKDDIAENILKDKIEDIGFNVK